ncbi:MAG: hypothetical protein SGJ20_18500 [Planctomycetota bacterium]|nr:hypothetical protein [Planctomycetota bacterium]
MFRCILALVIACLSTDVATAIITSGQQQVIDFTQPEQAAKLATWSEPERLGCTKEGFGWDGEKTTYRDGWIETEPLAIGRSWIPPQNAGIRITLQTNYPADVATGQKSAIFYTPSIYVRYSADRVHWSDWQPTDKKEDPRNPGTPLYTTRIGLARRASETYHAKLEEWSRRDDIDWGSDEDAFCRWLVKQDPEFFAKERPFIGYVQFLIEDSFKGSQRLTRFDAGVYWSVSGLHQNPKNPAGAKRQNDRGAWSFRGVEAAGRKEE